MDEVIILDDKANEPTDNDLKECFGPTFGLWVRVHDFVVSKYPGGVPEWYIYR